MKAFRAGDDWRAAVQETEKDVLQAIMATWREVLIPVATQTHDAILRHAKKSVTEDVIARWMAIIAQSSRTSRAPLITRTTIEMLAAIIEAAITEGLAIREVAKRITDVWEDISPARAERIARTEVIAAHNRASIEGARATGLKLKKVWLTTFDDRTRDTHQAMSQVAVELDGTFSVPLPGGGFESMEYPGDPSASAANVVNCRCTPIYEEQ